MKIIVEDEFELTFKEIQIGKRRFIYNNTLWGAVIKIQRRIFGIWLPCIFTEGYNIIVESSDIEQARDIARKRYCVICEYFENKQEKRNDNN